SLLRLGIKNRHIRSLDRRFPVNNATLGSALGIGLLMFLHNINASNQQLAFQNLNYFATLAFVSTGNNDDFIITFDFQHRLYPRFLQHFRGQGNNLHKLVAAQLTSNRPEDTCSDRLALVVQQHRGVLVKADERSVLATNTLASTNDNSIHYITLFNLAARNSFLDRHLNHITNTSIPAV